MGGNADFAADFVLHQHITGGFGHLETHRVRVAIGFELRHFFRSQGEGVAHAHAGGGVVLPHFSFRFSFRTLGGHVLRCIEGLVSGPAFEQALNFFLIEGAPIGLLVGPELPAGFDAFVRGNAAPIQRFTDVVFGSFDKTRLVGVLDAEDEGAAVLLGKEVIVQGRAHPAHVKWAGGAGGKSNANG